MSGLFEILQKIQARPGMYLGSPSITNLFIFVTGYKTARRELGVEPSELELEFYEEFQPWIQQRFNIQTVNSWAKIILVYSTDEREAFAYFFKLLDEFLERNKSVVSVVDTSQVEVGMPSTT